MSDLWFWLADHLPRRLVYIVLLSAAGRYYATLPLGEICDARLARMLDWYGRQVYPEDGER